MAKKTVTKKAATTKKAAKKNAVKASDEKELTLEDLTWEKDEFDPNEIPAFARDLMWRFQRKKALTSPFTYKPVGGEQMVIYPHEAARLLHKSIRTVQRSFTRIRKEFNISPRQEMPLDVFCSKYKLNAETARKTIADMY